MEEVMLEEQQCVINQGLQLNQFFALSVKTCLHVFHTPKYI